MTNSQTKIRKLLSRMSTPDTIGVLVLSFYVVNWLIYPEALDYLKMTFQGPAAGNSIGGLGHARGLEFACMTHVEGRTIVGVIEIGVGALRACLVYAILYTAGLYISRVSRKMWVRHMLVPLVVGLGIHFLHILVLAWMLITYPSHFSAKIQTSAILYYTSVGIAGANACVLAYVAVLELYRKRKVILNRVNTSLQLFKHR